MNFDTDSKFLDHYCPRYPQYKDEVTNSFSKSPFASLNTNRRMILCSTCQPKSSYIAIDSVYPSKNFEVLSLLTNSSK